MRADKMQHGGKRDGAGRPSGVRNSKQKPDEKRRVRRQVSLPKYLNDMLSDEPNFSNYIVMLIRRDKINNIISSGLSDWAE